MQEKEGYVSIEAWMNSKLQLPAGLPAKIA